MTELNAHFASDTARDSMKDEGLEYREDYCYM